MDLEESSKEQYDIVTNVATSRTFRNIDFDLDLNLIIDNETLQFEMIHQEDARANDDHFWGNDGVVDAIMNMKEGCTDQLEQLCSIALNSTTGSIAKEDFSEIKETESEDYSRPDGAPSCFPSSFALLFEKGVPGFLTKVFHIVDIPETDRIICWGEREDSFIIWDHIEFSSVVLPRYFKHKNFSSFNSQLNYYGFKKIGYDRCEFYHPCFIKGRQDMLKHIKGRAKLCKDNMKPRMDVNTELSKLQEQVQMMNAERHMLECEVKQLKQQLEISNGLVADVIKKVKAVEITNEKLAMYIVKAFENPCFIQQAIQLKKRKMQAKGNEVLKKSRSDVACEPEDLANAVTTNAFRKKGHQQLHSSFSWNVAGTATPQPAVLPTLSPL